MNSPLNVFKPFESISSKDIEYINNILDVILDLPKDKLVDMARLRPGILDVYNIEIKKDELKINIIVGNKDSECLTKDLLMFEGELIRKNSETEKIYDKVYNLVDRLIKDSPSKFEKIFKNLDELLK